MYKELFTQQPDAQTLRGSTNLYSSYLSAIMMITCKFVHIVAPDNFHAELLERFIFYFNYEMHYASTC
ncbi:hypothetical protein RIF29_17033 [Crotalaria pallida]|uniref:Uncharacterized protein n=1 Tax=Crotalaria pallida TaxID=3830 RepID=A0AAN9FGD8_CROPI